MRGEALSLSFFPVIVKTNPVVTTHSIPGEVTAQGLYSLTHDGHLDAEWGGEKEGAVRIAEVLAFTLPPFCSGWRKTQSAFFCFSVSSTNSMQQCALDQSHFFESTIVLL